MDSYEAAIDTRNLSGAIDLLAGAVLSLSGIVMAIYDGQPLKEKMLMLNGLAHSHRLHDHALPGVAIEAGIAAEAGGAYYHPAVNQKLDELSQGKTSMWQLESLLNNIHTADKITK